MAVSRRAGLGQRALHGQRVVDAVAVGAEGGIAVGAGERGAADAGGHVREDRRRGVPGRAIAAPLAGGHVQVAGERAKVAVHGVRVQVQHGAAGPPRRDPVVVLADERVR